MLQLKWVIRRCGGLRNVLLQIVIGIGSRKASVLPKFRILFTFRDTRILAPLWIRNRSSKWILLSSISGPDSRILVLLLAVTLKSGLLRLTKYVLLVVEGIERHNLKITS